jgi:hypothetical protein
MLKAVFVAGSAAKMDWAPTTRMAVMQIRTGAKNRLKVMMFNVLEQAEAFLNYTINRESYKYDRPGVPEPKLRIRTLASDSAMDA